MKARVQKLMQRYLQGEREGFSLVELIIVIAIMAILIAVVALAVIPYLNSARESKEHDAVNNMQSAFKSVMAKETYAKKYGTGGTSALTTATVSTSLDKELKDAIEKYTDKTIAETEDAFTSDKAKGKKLYFQISDKKCIVFIGESATKAVEDSDGAEFKAQ